MEVLFSILSVVGEFVKAHGQIFLILLATMNVYAFTVYGLDKRYAQKKQWRIPEAHLILTAALFGAIGAFLGMRIFRHKTKHKKFTITVPLFLILQITLIAAILAV